LIDKEMPVIVIAPNDDLIEKLKSNLHEVRARGGELIVFADEALHLKNEPGTIIVKMPKIPQEYASILAPILYTIPLQLLAYHVAVLKGTDVDQPRNLAKSVTVE
jgi:glutamine---fructose-6-phosphate transaminase (isomerizing)